MWHEFKKIEKVALKALLYYLFTTITGIIIALTLANTIKPGSRASYNDTANSNANSNNNKNDNNAPKVKEEVLIINTIFDLIR